MRKILVKVNDLNNNTVETAELEVCEKVAYACTQQHMDVPPYLSNALYKYFKEVIIPFIFGKDVGVFSNFKIIEIELLPEKENKNNDLK